MDRFEPSLLDRLLDSPVSGGPAGRQWCSLSELKDTVARDVETLLNTRCALPQSCFAGFGEVQRSIMGFGMRDFSCMSLVSESDRREISASIESAIRFFEPRLRQARVVLEARTAKQQRLEFSISALLVLKPFQEAISFDALLHPVTQQYTVRRSVAGQQARAA